MWSEWIHARTVLWYVAFFGFAVNYMIRINVNIAIVAMVAPRTNRFGQLAGECSVETNATTSVKMEANDTSMKQMMEGRFSWDENEQGLVLGAFFWLHWITQLPGGMLAQRFGAKKVFGLSQLAGCLMCLLIPAASYYSLNALLFLRFAQGIVAGLTWPAMHTMTGKWIPPNERSKFVTSYMGSSVGTALTYPVCGLLIDWYGWESVFYVSGVLGVLWYFFWFFFVFDSPSDHPRITEKERKYIEESLGRSGKKQKLNTPWKAIMLSRPLWMNVLAQWGGLWGLFTVLTQAPTYFKVIHGWDVRATGVFSGMPHLLRMIVAIFFSSFGDYLLRKNKMSRTNVRKLATAVCTLGQSAMLFGLALAGCNSIAAIVLVTAATGIHGSVSTGPLASLVDIGPNFAGILFGVCNTIAAMPGFISPAIVGVLTLNNQTVDQWQIVFLISGGMCLVCGLLHLFFSTSDVQWWNSPDTPEKGEALEPLHKGDSLHVTIIPKTKEPL